VLVISFTDEVEIMREKKYVKFFILFILLFAVGCNGIVFKTLVDNSSDSTPPSVVSVYSTAIDSVRVEFSEDIDTTEGSNASNYTINGLNIFSAAVTANPKVVRLTTDPQFYQLYDITISTNITDLKGNKMASTYNGTFQGAVEEPRIANITTTSVTGVLVEFSEEVNITADDPASYLLSPSLSISDVDFPYGGDPTFALLTIFRIQEAFRSIHCIQNSVSWAMRGQKSQ